MIAWFKGEPLSELPRSVQWCLLLVLSAVLVALLEWARLPAALMLGPMIAGILMESGGGNLRVPAMPMLFAQAVIGCLVARMITSQILKTFTLYWPLFIGIMLAMIVSSLALGWLLTRLRLFPGTTAVWGLLPGAASVMMLMADDFGADGRLVAFMQYLRVVFVALAAAFIARFWVHASAHAAPVVWFPPIHGPAFLETLIFITISVVLGVKSRIPGGAILVPLFLEAVLKVTGVLTIELPQWFLAASYALIGWSIGLRFTREILLHATRTLPQTIVSVILLMAFCASLAWVLVKTVGVDPLTAYLATSPGGVDSAAIIAASTKVDMSFVMSMQVARLLIILSIGPAISRWIARRVTGQRPSK